MLHHTITYTIGGNGTELTATIHRARRLTYAGCARVLAAMFGVAPRTVNICRVEVATLAR